MALLPTTGLENHPVGTTGLNGIINGNWERLEAIFAALSPASATGRIHWDATNKKFILRPGQAALTFATTRNLDFAGACTQTLTLTGNVTFITSGLAAGAELRVILTADATPRTLTFPGWKFLGAAAPGSLAANKTAMLELISTGTFDVGVLAKWTVEP